MATTFDRAVQTGIGTSSTLIYTTPVSTTTVVIGFIITNTTASTITVTVVSSGVSMTVPIPANSAFSPLLGKDVMVAGDTVLVQSDTAGSCDVKLSYMEQT